MSVSRCMASALTKNEQQAQADAELALQAHEEYLSVQNFHLNALKRELKSFDDKQRRRMAGIPTDDDGQKEDSRRRLSAMDDEELDAVIAEHEKNAEDARSVHRSLLGLVVGDDDVVQIAIDVDGAQQHQQEFDDHRGLLQMDAYELREFILKSEEDAFDARETKRRRMSAAKGDSVEVGGKTYKVLEVGGETYTLSGDRTVGKDKVLSVGAQRKAGGIVQYNDGSEAHPHLIGAEVVEWPTAGTQCTIKIVVRKDKAQKVGR